jgi:hypothetical protein
MFATSDTTESDSRGYTYHGTCMLGKIAGDKMGIEKKVSLIVVKVGSINGPAG